MMWKFWKKNTSTKNAKSPNLEKLTRPKEIPDRIGMHLVAELHKNPDWVWTLKAVERIKSESKQMADIRIFDPGRVVDARVEIKTFHSLDGHPELILYEGWMNKKTKEFQIQEITELADKKMAA